MFSALRAVVAFGLDVDLPLAAEAVEVVHEVAAHEGLERLVDVAELDALLEHLVAVDVDETCGTAGRNVVLTPASLRPLARRGHEGRHGSRARNATSLPARSSSMKVTPPAVPMPGIAGGGKANATPSGIC